MHLLYNICIFFYRFGIALAAFFNEKARLWQRGRKKIFDNLIRTFDGTEHPVWIHSASLGEYEQAKPIIEAIKKEHPDIKVLATFFSPSGYEIRKNDSLPDYIYYLPMDFPRHAQKFLSIVQPQAAIFVKYEFWFNYMRKLHQRDIPFFYVCAIFRPTQYFFKPIGRWFAKQLRNAAGFFVQNEESAQLLQSIDIHNIQICGDTRFDRVHQIATKPYQLDFVEQFANQQKLIVAGSTWQPDEALLSQTLSQLDEYKMIVAPHEINRTDDVLKTFEAFKVIRYSEMEDKDLKDYNVLLLDTIGLLSKVYKYSTLSYVGGAFKTGLHNILEAAVFGVPLFFGPHYEKFNEAVMLTKQKGAYSINTSDQMLDIVRRFDNEPAFYQQTCTICRQFVEDNLGACDKIINIINNYIK